MTPSPRFSTFNAPMWQSGVPTAQIMAGVNDNRAGNSRPVGWMSANGLDWTFEQIAAINQTTPWGIAYSSTLGLWAVGLRNFSAGGGYIYTRSDAPPGEGVWTQRLQAQSFSCMAWSPSLGLFVAASDSIGQGLRTSTNGVTWTARSSPDARSWQQVVDAPEIGKMLIVGLATTGGASNVLTSTNGTSWTSGSGPTAANFSGIWDCVWSPELGLFVAVGNETNGGNGCIWTSPNGTSWTQRLSPAQSGQDAFHAAAWSARLGLFLAASFFSNDFWYSSDGMSWTKLTDPVGAGFTFHRGICDHPGLGLMVDCGHTSAPTAGIYTSPDGLAWTNQTGFSGVSASRVWPRVVA